MTTTRATTTPWVELSWALGVMLLVAGVNILLNMHLGTRDGGDTPRYTQSVPQLLSGEQLHIRAYAYYGYVVFLAAVQKLGLGLAKSVQVSFAIAALAGAAAYGLGCRLGGRSVGIACGIMWGLWIDIHRWNSYILTDGLFISSVMLCCGLLAWAERGRAGRLALALLAVICMASIRANGFFLGLLALAYLLLTAERRGKLMVLAVLPLYLLILPTSPLFGLVFSPSGYSKELGMFTLEFMVRGDVLWDTVFTPMPPAPVPSGSLVIDYLTYMVAAPLAVARLYVLRLGYYLFAYNPLYSLPHQVANALAYGALYALSLAGLVLTPLRRDRLVQILLAFWLLQTMLVVVTVGDYDNRFTLYCVPALLPIAAAGAVAILRKVRAGHSS